MKKITKSMSKKPWIVLVSGLCLLALVMVFMLGTANESLANINSGYTFLLDSGAKGSGYFVYCDGIGSTSEVVEHSVVGAGGLTTVQKLPGRTNYHDVVFKRAVTADTTLWQWRAGIEDGDYNNTVSPMTVTVLNQAGETVAVWTLTGAWVSSITTELIDNTYVEVVTVTCEDISRDQ